MGLVVARLDGAIGFDTVVGAESDLRRNIRGVAEVAELDGDETGWLLGQVAALRRLE